MAFESHFFRRAAVGVVIALLLASAFFADARADDSGSVSGTVFFRNSQVPVSDVSVRITDPLGTYRILSTTDISGHFGVVGLQPGRYTGLFEKSGLENVLIRFDICPGAQTTMTALMRSTVRYKFGSFKYRWSDEQPKPSIFSTSNTMVLFNQWSGMSPPRCN
jgi:hypothetical protein